MTGNSTTGLLPPSVVPIDQAMLDPKPLIQSGRNWTRWAGPLVSVLILVVALHQFLELVEKLGLKYPLLLFAAAAETIDLVLKRRRGLFV